MMCPRRFGSQGQGTVASISVRIRPAMYKKIWQLIPQPRERSPGRHPTHTHVAMHTTDFASFDMRKRNGSGDEKTSTLSSISPWPTGCLSEALAVCCPARAAPVRPTALPRVGSRSSPGRDRSRCKISSGNVIALGVTSGAAAGDGGACEGTTAAGAPAGALRAACLMADEALLAELPISYCRGCMLSLSADWMP